jgi:hypothetical protein
MECCTASLDHHNEKDCRTRHVHAHIEHVAATMPFLAKETCVIDICVTSTF